MIPDLQQRVIRALAYRAMDQALGEATLYPEDLGTIDYQLAVYPKDDPPRLIVKLITRERFEELGKQGVPQL